MSKQHSPPKKAADYKSGRQRVLEIALISSLLILSSLFYAFKKFDTSRSIVIPLPRTTLIASNIPRTKPPQKINRPKPPSIPVPSEDPEISQEVTIDYDEIDIEELIENSGPPIDDEEEIYEFIAVSEKPEVLVKAVPEYPKLALNAGISGQVVTRVLIDKKGNVEKAEIYKSVPMLDEAALDAAKRCKFKPGKQRDKYVKVWMSIPFRFVLK